MPIARVIAGTAALRAEPDRDAELVDQLRYGERVTILAAPGSSFSFIQAREDHYFGWVERTAISETDEVPARVVVTRALATLSDAPLGASIDTLPAGTWIEPREARGPSVSLRQGWLRSDDLTAAERLPFRSPTSEDLLAAARAFVDVPYLWGGTTARGLDCSGLVQLAYRLCGIVLTRDAEQQATQGRPVTGDPRAADLLFFGSPADHVGMFIADGAMIHAAGGDVGRVVEQPVAERGTPVSVRRYLP